MDREALRPYIQGSPGRYYIRARVKPEAPSLERDYCFFSKLEAIEYLEEWLKVQLDKTFERGEE